MFAKYILVKKIFALSKKSNFASLSCQIQASRVFEATLNVGESKLQKCEFVNH